MDNKEHNVTELEEAITSTKVDSLCVDTIRTLAMDAVQTANSGHPGTPMALAPVAFTLFDRLMKFDPKNPEWANRDRFILSVFPSFRSSFAGTISMSDSPARS